MGKGNPGNTFCKTRKIGKGATMSGKHILCVLRRKIFSYFWLSSFHFQIFCGSFENEHFWKSVFFVIPNQWERLYFWKCLFSLFSLALLLDMTLTGRCCPASVIMAGLARPVGRHAAGSGSRPQRGERENGHLFLENDHLPSYCPRAPLGPP